MRTNALSLFIALLFSVVVSLHGLFSLGFDLSLSASAILYMPQCQFRGEGPEIILIDFVIIASKILDAGIDYFADLGGLLLQQQLPTF